MRAVRALALVNFYSLNPEVRVEINPVTGVPEDMWGDISRYQTKSDPVEAAYEFFEQNKELYGINNLREELKLKGKAMDQYGGMVEFKQLYKGVEVNQSSLRAYYTPSGKLKGIMGGFAQISELSPTPTIDSLSAIGIVKRDLNYSDEEERKIKELYERQSIGGIKIERSLPSAALTVKPLDGKYHLVWVVQVQKGYFGDWQYLIDAHSGDILGKGNWAEGERHPRSSSPWDSSGAQRRKNMAPAPKPVPEKEVPIFKADSARPIPELQLNKQDNTPGTKNPSVSPQPDISSPTPVPIRKGSGQLSPCQDPRI